MPTVNKIPAGFAVCDNCGEKRRTIGWALTERLQMGYQGLGSVKLCPNCLASERASLVRHPAFVEELKDTLRASGVGFSAGARREELQAMVDKLPRPTVTASSSVTIQHPDDAPPPAGAPVPVNPPPTEPDPLSTEALMALTREALVEQAVALGLQQPPMNATKPEIVKRIQAKAAEVG